jgi:hypothetical protein
MERVDITKVKCYIHCNYRKTCIIEYCFKVEVALLMSNLVDVPVTGEAI